MFCPVLLFYFGARAVFLPVIVSTLLPSHLSQTELAVVNSGDKVADLMQAKRRIVASPLQSWRQPESGSCQGDTFYSLLKQFSELALAARTLQTTVPASTFDLLLASR